jgi:putative hydrolase of the HAD superfamily
MVDLKRIKYIAFDADDTLWHNERLFTATEVKFRELLLRYHNEAWIDAKLYETQLKNLEHFGYGVKGFTLSMIESAVELSEGRVTGDEIAQIISYSKEMISSPVELLDGIEETIYELSKTHKLMVITKGDLFDQESKIARSGIGDYFDHVEVVPRKTSEVYEKILSKQNVLARNFMMVGNSLKSDVFPVASIGGTGVHIPYETTWAHEAAESHEIERHNFIHLENIRKLPELFG